ncbi:MAG TPA: hypothetical protein VFG70_04805 [Gaiellaceae bacterium]|nr:hypothetical protein [Gaiellaceae bacterium]
MFARVATFENRDVTRADELVEFVRSRAVTGDAIPELVRHVMLLDPRDRSALEVTFFDSEDALMAAEPVLEGLGAEIPETVRGRRTSVSVYEVALDAVNGATGTARMASLRVAPDRLADALYSIREQAHVEEDELDGWNGIVALVDHETGQTKTITFWESDDALRRSEIRETQLRCRVVAAGDGSIASVHAYDVAVNDVPVGV